MLNVTLLGFQLYSLIYYFVCYAFLGWCLESTYATILKKRFVNRGFLNGPFCPIYGFGALLIVVLLHPIKDTIFSLFVWAVVLTSTLEYITGYILEKAFHSTWWDYKNEPFNIKGRICLKFSLLWGIISFVVVKTIHPAITHIINFIPATYGTVMAYILIFYFLADFTVTICSIIQLNSLLKQLNEVSTELRAKIEALKEVTSIKAEEIEKRLEELKIKYELLSEKRTILHSRIIKAFPQLKSTKFDYILKDIRDRVNKQKFKNGI